MEINLSKYISNAENEIKNMIINFIIDYLEKNEEILFKDNSKIDKNKYILKLYYSLGNDIIAVCNDSGDINDFNHIRREKINEYDYATIKKIVEYIE